MNNEDEINGGIQIYNRKLKKISGEVLLLSEEISSLYDEAMSEKKLSSSVELLNYTESLKSKIKQKETIYNNKLKDLTNLLNNTPILSSKNWEYTYDVGSPSVQPNLLNIGKQGIQGQQRLLQHRKELIEKVTQELIRTIKIY